MLRLIGLTIKGIILLTVTIVAAQFITLSDDTWSNIGNNLPTEDQFSMAVGGLAVILVLAIVCKVASFVGPVFKVVLFPVLVPFKVLGAIASVGRNSTPSAPRSAPRSAPAPRKSAVRITKSAPRKLERKVEPKPQRTYEIKWIHRSTPKNVHTINSSIRANSLTEARMMVENSETSFGQFGSMNEIVSMRVWG